MKSKIDSHRGMGAKYNSPAILAKSEETLMIFAEEARSREGKKALEVKNGP
jgi:hypothetical protein